MRLFASDKKKFPVLFPVMGIAPLRDSRLSFPAGVPSDPGFGLLRCTHRGKSESNG